MRLMNVHTRDLESFDNENVPNYAILSHVWGEEEVTFTDFHQQHARSMKGYAKIDYLCRQAMLDGLAYVWIDTCAIDKSSSSELSEAINSMYMWYQKAYVCYAYLIDVSSPTHLSFNRSRWFKRGWTLQELLAPNHMVFYGAGWVHLGDKLSLIQQITNASGIPDNVLRFPKMIQCYSIAAKMCWAANRVTTRVEDRAYSLLGLFDINMPLVYGEGTKAFTRLQEELAKTSDDESLFVHTDHEVLATDPNSFRSAQNIAPLLGKKRTRPYTMTNKGLHIELPLLTRVSRPDEKLGILNCHILADYSNYIAIPLGQTGKHDVFSRLQVHDTKWVQVSAEEAEKAELRSIYIATDVSTQNNSAFWVNSSEVRNAGYEPRPPVGDSRMDQGKAMLVWQPDLPVFQLFSLVNAYVKFGMIFVNAQKGVAFCLSVRSCGLYGYPVEFGLASYYPLPDSTLNEWITRIDSQIKSLDKFPTFSETHLAQATGPLFKTEFAHPPNANPPRVRINEAGVLLHRQESASAIKTVRLDEIQATLHWQEKLGEGIWVLELSVIPA